MEDNKSWTEKAQEKTAADLDKLAVDAILAGGIDEPRVSISNNWLDDLSDENRDLWKKEGRIKLAEGYYLKTLARIPLIAQYNPETAKFGFNHMGLTVPVGEIIPPSVIDKVAVYQKQIGKLQMKIAALIDKAKSQKPE